MGPLLPTESTIVVFKNSIWGSLQPLGGFHQIEEDELGPFVWTEKRFQIRRPAAEHFIAVNLCYYGNRGKLFAKSVVNGQSIKISLRRGWATYPFDLSDLDGPDVEFEVDPLISVKGDSRELGVMIRSFEPLVDLEQYELVRKKMSNRLLNTEEFLEGKAKLRSLPPHIRIDIETRCNLSPRCEYCHWDWSKSIEQESPLGSLPATVLGLEEFLTYAEQIVDCGLGEPLLNPDLPQLLAELSARRIRLELTTNGVLLTPDIRKMLLGRQLTLYVSVDSATEQGYRRYRHANLDKILNNLRELCAEKRNYRGLPHTFASFIAMSSNLGEFEQFLERMATTGVDSIKIRSLFCDPEYVDANGWASSAAFDYRRELLDPAALCDFLDKAKPLARSAGMPLTCDSDFGGDLESPEVPLCTEPWKTIYVLNRGIMHCCFAKSPILAWNQRGDKTLIQFIRYAWNSPIMQEIRAALANRQLHDCCVKAKSCPIVQKWSLGQAK
jgi:MoaA/NifB/PqqE/SkfB family radical SAM enzyme